MQELGRKILIRRSQLDMTQQELSKKSGVGTTELCFIEKGRVKPRVATLIKLEKALDLPEGELVKCVIKN